MNVVDYQVEKIYSSIIKKSEGIKKPVVFIKRAEIEYSIPIFVVSYYDLTNICETIWDDFEMLYMVSEKDYILDFLYATIALHCELHAMPFNVMKIGEPYTHSVFAGSKVAVSSQVKYIYNNLKKNYPANVCKMSIEDQWIRLSSLCKS